MELLLSVDGPGDRSAGLYRQLHDAMMDGRLTPGDRLPPTRALAGQLGVSRGTVTTAYDRLLAEGFLVSRVGAGTFVADCVTPRRSRQAPGGEVRARPVWDNLPAPVPDAPPAELDLSVGGPDNTLFPLATWRRLVSATLRPSLLTASAYEGSGHPGLQQEIARYAAQARSLAVSPADVLLTNGAQQALDLTCRALIEPGDVVAVEDPGYTAAVRLFASHGAAIHGVRVDAEGLVVEDLPDRARVVYVTPSHQFPTGAVMSLSRRMALLQWAAERDAVIVEDDYDSEFRFDDRPLAPLQNLDRDGRVIYVGSFSKTLMPALRVGYLVAPQSIQGALRQAKLLTDWQGDAVTQGALARFMHEGLLAAHVRRVTLVYAERRTALLTALATQADDILDVIPAAAGLHVCTYFTDRGVDDVAAVAAAAARGVALEPLSVRYQSTPARPGLSMGFRRITPERVPEAIGRLVSVLAAHR